MQLLERLQSDMKAAMKAGDKSRLGVIRMLIADVKNIDLQPTKPTPEQAVEAYAKRLRKSQEEYTKLGKSAEVEQLSAELAVVEDYLPKKLSPEQTEAKVDAFLAEKSFDAKQAGQAIGQFMKAHGADVDPGVASALIRKKLGAG